MKQWIEEMWRLLLITVLGFAGSMIAGLMIYGGDVFIPQSAGFAYYIMFGLSTSFIFAFYHVRGLSNTITAAVSTGAVIFVVASFWMPVLNAAIWSFGVNLSVVVLAFLFERKLANFRHWKFLVVGVVYGAIFVLLTFLVGVLTRVAIMPPALFQKNYLDGLWLGLSLGIGVEIAESIVHSVDLHREATREKMK
jgi:ABC-type multidrug transport system permease subunit